MNQGVIASRYAMTLYMYSVEEGVSDKVYKEAMEMLTAMEKKRGLDSIPSFSPHMCKFLSLVSRNGRMNYLLLILYIFLLLYRYENKIASVHITTATATDSMDEVVNRHLEEMGYKSAEIQHTVDPSIVGGYILRIDDKLMDASVTSMLEKLRRNFDEKTSSKKF